MIKTKRIYDKPDPDDGFRILVDRIWPRGIKKTVAKIDLWEKNIAPSTSLRRWFNHDQRKWTEFKTMYFELKSKEDIIKIFLEKAEKETVTLLYSSKEEKYNNATALKEYLQFRL